MKPILVLAVAFWCAGLQAADPRARAAELSRSAWAQMRQSQYERALAGFRQVVDIARGIGDRALEGRTINFIGLLYQQMGETGAALAHYRQALAIAREARDRRLEGEVLYHQAWLQFQLDRFRQALPIYAESLRARRDVADAHGEAVTLLGLGMTHASLGEPDRALEYEQEGLAIAERIGNLGVQADALDHIGTALTLLGRPAEAMEKHARALELRRADGQVSSVAFSLSGLARAQRAGGRLAEAVNTMAELIDVLEGSRRNLATRRFRGSVFARLRGHYDRYIEYLMDAGEVATALGASERARARLTLDAVQGALARADADAGGTLVQREQSLQNAIERAGADLDELLAELTQVEEEIRRQFPRLAAARDELPLTAEQLQAELSGRDMAVVEYSLTGERAFVWIVTHDSVRGRELSRPGEITSVSRQLHALLSKGDQRAKRHEIERLMERLRTLIVTPLELPRVARLLVVPDGALFYVPFAALTDRYEITMAPSASAAVLMRKAAAGRTWDGDLAIFADPVFSSADPRVAGKDQPAAPDAELLRAAADAGLAELRRLPSTRVEADAIAKVARGSIHKALDFDASRKAVLGGSVGRYRVMHFATHALLNAKRPDASGIVLSLVDRRGAAVNGFVRVHDLYRMDVTSDLVVLSACRTALGKELRGEGIVGMVNAFMHAGAPRVVASYWDVKDEATAELMQRFYRGMFHRGLAPAAALREAQRSMRKEPRWRSPYYWASFAIWGSW